MNIVETNRSYVKYCEIKYGTAFYYEGVLYVSSYVMYGNVDCDMITDVRTGEIFDGIDPDAYVAPAEIQLLVSN
jgi:hypothetical protein